MVDLGVSTRVAGLVLSARLAVPDLKILVGDSATPLGNPECAVGVQIAANSSFAQVRSRPHPAAADQRSSPLPRTRVLRCRGREAVSPIRGRVGKVRDSICVTFLCGFPHPDILVPGPGSHSRISSLQLDGHAEPEKMY